MSYTEKTLQCSVNYGKSFTGALGDETLREIAKEIADRVRANASIDWTIRESTRARLMVIVRRTLSKYGYPPDKQEKAIEIVMKQAELMATNRLVNR